MTTLSPSPEVPLPRDAAPILTISDDEILALAADVGATAAAHDTGHDRDATFVTEAYDRMHELGYLSLPVPTELGGRGASMRQVVLAQHELGRHSGAAALASTMHLYLTFVQRWRHQHGAADAGGVLGKVLNERLVMATSGGSDWVCPTTVATPVEGGYLFNGRKVFCSQAPVATVVSTCAVLGDPGADAVVLHAGVPMSTEGVSIVRTWDTLGMRGTESQDLLFTDVFVPTEKVVGQRDYGSLSGPLLVAALHFAPLVGAAYLGIASGACDRATSVVASRGTAGASAVRQIGDMTARLRVALWALLGALDETGDDLTANESTLEVLMIAKRHAICEARSVVDLALETAGGSAFFRSSPLERAYRDVRGGPFHPLTPEATLELVGARALAQAAQDAGQGTP